MPQRQTFIEVLKNHLKRIFPKVHFSLLWKAICPYWWLPWSPLFQPRWPMTRKIIELEIIYSCDLSCLNCECCFKDAPSEDFMSPEQVKKFVDESISLNWDWEKIKIRGGEPTLHPQLSRIIEHLEVYRQFNPKCEFYILTNGFSKKAKEVLSTIPPWITIVNSHKDISSGKRADIWQHDSINIAPADLSIYQCADFTKGCHRVTDCGMALSKYGYYPCSTAIHVSRIFGLDVGIKKLSLVNDDSMAEILNVLCRYCGHYKQPNDIAAKHIISRSWEKAFKKYKEKKPNLSLYE